MIKSKKLYIWISMISLIGILAACQSNTDDETDTANETEQEELEVPIQTGKTPEVTMTMDNGEEVLIELYPDRAKNTVDNFISLIEDGFYDGLIFHRVIPGFMVQGGDPDGTGMGGPGYAIRGEFINNGYKNELIHERGVLSMARSQSNDSAGSQFFIMVDDANHLDQEYAGFGRVIEGMEVIDDIVAAETDKSDKPVEDQVIQSMTVDLKGYEAEEPEKIE